MTTPNYISINMTLLSNMGSNDSFAVCELWNNPTSLLEPDVLHEQAGKGVLHLSHDLARAGIKAEDREFGELLWLSPNCTGS